MVDPVKPPTKVTPETVVLPKPPVVAKKPIPAPVKTVVPPVRTVIAPVKVAAVPAKTAQAKAPQEAPPTPNKYISALLPMIEKYAGQSLRLIEDNIQAGDGATLAIRKTWDTRPAITSQIWVSVGAKPKGNLVPTAKAWRLAANEKQAIQMVGRVPVDLIIIDRNCSKDEFLRLLVNYSAVAGPKTVWLFHDICRHGVANTAMLTGIQEFLSKNKIKYRYQTLATVSHGLGALVPI